MEAFLNVKYKQVSTSDNYEDFLKFVGLNLLMRKAATTVSPVCILTKEGDVYILTLSAAMKANATKFKLNEEFEEDKANGSKAKSIITMEGTKLIQVQNGSDGMNIKTEREFSENKLIMRNTAEGFDGVVIREFERIN